MARVIGAKAKTAPRCTLPDVSSMARRMSDRGPPGGRLAKTRLTDGGALQATRGNLPHPVGGQSDRMFYPQGGTTNI